MTMNVTSPPILAIAACATLLGLAANEAHADPPAWCSGIKGLSQGNLKRAQTETDIRSVLYEVVGLTCRPDKRNPEADVAALRDQLARQLALTDADWADVAAWAGAEQGRRMNASIPFDRKQAWSELTPIDQFGAIVENDEFIYLTDALDTRLSALGRYAYVLACSHVDRGASSVGPEVIVHWAVCQPDVEALDKKKMFDEIRADQAHTGFDRIALRIKVSNLEKVTASLADKIRKVTGSDKAYPRLFQAAAEGRKVALDPDLVQLALAMDDARITNSNRAHDGCEARTTAAFKKAIAAIPAKRFANIRIDSDHEAIVQVLQTINTDPNGYLAGLAYFNCRWKTDDGHKMWRDILVHKLGDTQKYWPGYRGPRSAAYTSLLDASIQPDDRAAAIKVPHAEHRWMESGGGGGATSGSGLVESAKPSGDRTLVKFVKKLVTVSVCKNWVDTRHVTAIRDNGTVVYEQNCTSRGTETINLASKPQTVGTAWATGLKGGMVVQTNDEYVVIAWPKSGAKLPSHVFGAPVK